MPTYHLHFSDGRQTFPNDMGVEFADLEEAYLEVCAAIPDMASDLIIRRQNPLAAFYIITDAKDRVLMTVPFTEVLAPSEWQPPMARWRPHGGPRSERARNDMALAGFRRMFSSVDVGCVMLSPEMQVVEMNEFGARHSHVDPDAIRGLPIFEIFEDLRGKPKADFNKFMSLAQAGVVSEVTDLPYLVLDSNGRTTNGWWNARTWPIFDDDNHLLGFVEWAEPYTTPTRGGTTVVSVGKRARA